MADRFAAGGRLFTFGNGGSSTDAASLAALFAPAAVGRVRCRRARLVDDSAVLTALGNDVGFDLVFSRQLIAHAARGDIAIGLSTSGNSRNLLHAFEEAARRGLLTIGIAGYDGGEMARSTHVQHCLRGRRRQRPPHPGDAGRAGVRAVARRSRRDRATSAMAADA